MGVGNPLGYCEKCKGPLCVSGKQVACEKCGNPVPDHPAVQQVGPPPRPSDFVIPPQENAVTHIDRLNALEKKVADQCRRLAQLEGVLTQQQAQQQGQRQQTGRKAS